MEKDSQWGTSRKLRWLGHIARMAEVTSGSKILTDISTRKRPSGRPKRRWEDNIRMNLEKIGTNTKKWVDWAYDTGLLERSCECGIEPPGSISHGVSVWLINVRWGRVKKNPLACSCREERFNIHIRRSHSYEQCTGKEICVYLTCILERKLEIETALQHPF